MVIKSVNLETVCGITSTFPVHTLPEIAFAGKSNVGKSSLINALMNRSSYARTSSKPGKTQTINYYNVNDAVYFVDLPGYGYATANVQVKAEWGKMIEKYLNTATSLKAIFLLVDIRHDPGENDLDMYKWIRHNGYQPIVIATKLDKLKRSEVKGKLDRIRTVLGNKEDLMLFPFSSQTKQGRDELYDFMDELLENAQGDK
ncbi:MAG: ribosome biogenesis GTP-binding protein YihA/YsxC [Lachnospiraceae bacterium]|nr:ribosome biogenesis GTP-binding protein YihA/YsxC [Lachnospiraceae bacterium]